MMLDALLAAQAIRDGEDIPSVPDIASFACKPYPMLGNESCPVNQAAYENVVKYITALPAANDRATIKDILSGHITSHTALTTYGLHTINNPRYQWNQTTRPNGTRYYALDINQAFEQGKDAPDFGLLMATLANEAIEPVIESNLIYVPRGRTPIADELSPELRAAILQDPEPGFLLHEIGKRKLQSPETRAR